MKKLILFLFIPLLTYSQKHSAELQIFVTNFDTSWAVTFTASTQNSRWDENFFLTSSYLSATVQVPKPGYPTNTVANFDLVYDFQAGVNPIMALGIYKISAIIGGLEKAYIYMDWRTSDYPNHFNSPDVKFYYDYKNKSFLSYSTNQNINGTTQTVWDLVQELEYDHSGLELYLNLSSSNNKPYLTWNDYFNTDFVPNQFKIYRSIRSTFPTSESHFTCIATVNRSTRSYTDMSYEIGDDSKAWYRVKAYKSTSPTKSSLSSNIEGIEIDFPSKESASNNSCAEGLKYGLHQNYPNPFNPTTTINYELERNSFVSLNVYNSLGEMVARLVNQNEEAGVHSIKFEATNLPSGIYFYKIVAGNFIEIKKMILLR